MKQELDEALCAKYPDGYWLHPEDVTGNMRRIEALNLIISDFVETSDEIK